MTIYNTSFNGTHPEIRKVNHMFQRMPDGHLRVMPRIMVNLRMLWDALEVEVCVCVCVDREAAEIWKLLILIISILPLLSLMTLLFL